ncbi:hypothetical protein, partial [Photorhabdus australis]|uniref:hypothetical protein n=1 Tax=Photorhabdus australis TaxID=286156 RepID=UPI00196A15BE
RSLKDEGYITTNENRILHCIIAERQYRLNYQSPNGANTTNTSYQSLHLFLGAYLREVLLRTLLAPLLKLKTLEKIVTLCTKTVPKIWGIITKQLNISNHIFKMSAWKNHCESALNDALVYALHSCRFLLLYLSVISRNILLFPILLCELLLAAPSFAQTEIPLTTSDIRTSIGPVVKGGGIQLCAFRDVGRGISDVVVWFRSHSSR